jgi:hypothetical protein
MMTGWGRRCRGAAILGLVLIAVPASTALGAPKKYKPTVIAVKEQQGGIDPGSVAAVDAKCPTGFDVIGGSYLIGGDSVLAHAAGAAPFWRDDFYRAIIVNPPTSPFVRAQEASVTVVAECAVNGKPLVVDGQFPSAPGGNGPKATDAPQTGNMTTHTEETLVSNGRVSKLDSECDSKNVSVFGGGYTISGSLFAHAPIAAVLSKTRAYSATLVNPGVNPALGVTKSPARIQVAALCAESGVPIVPNPGDYDTYARTPVASATRTGLRTTVVIRKATTGGITAGSIDSAQATCPRGYSVFGGSYLIGGNSVLAHVSVAAVFSGANAYGATVVNPPPNINTGVPRSTATLTVAANCAKRATPIVVNGSFGGG